MIQYSPFNMLFKTISVSREKPASKNATYDRTFLVCELLLDADNLSVAKLVFLFS